MLALLRPTWTGMSRSEKAIAFTLAPFAVVGGLLIGFTGAFTAAVVVLAHLT